MAIRKRVLVVEDEMLVAMMVEDMLAELGHEVVGPAMRLEAALSLARNATIDIAVLDVNLGGAKSFPIADVLKGRGIPFLFATGYGRKGVDAAYKDAIVLDKPFEVVMLQHAFNEVLRSSAV